MSSASSPNCPVCDEFHPSLIDHLTEQVDALFHYRDHYFETHPLEAAAGKPADIAARLAALAQRLLAHEPLVRPAERARFAYLRGRLLNAAPAPSAEAERLLARAVKLDPRLADAWLELGECLWKADRPAEARHCFEGALREGRGAAALRCLSMAARQAPAEGRAEREAGVARGLEAARAAVRLDPRDGRSWAVLGNAHLAAFFGVRQDPATLRRCLGAYAQAERDAVARGTPDLHYNKAVTLQYEEEFERALAAFETAALYDPTWEQARAKQRHLLRYVGDISELVASSGKMKTKRLQQLVGSISAEKQLGPFAGGSYTSTSKETVKLVLVDLRELKAGVNEELVVLGKVVCSVQNDDSVPFTFCMVDKVGTCVVVTVYNLADGKGVIIGDAVAIPEPYVTDVDFVYKEKEYKFRLIRVETPLVMVVNGKKLGRDLQAGVQMSIFKKFE